MDVFVRAMNSSDPIIISTLSLAKRGLGKKDTLPEDVKNLLVEDDNISLIENDLIEGDEVEHILNNLEIMNENFIIDVNID